MKSVFNKSFNSYNIRNLDLRKGITLRFTLKEIFKGEPENLNYHILDTSVVTTEQETEKNNLPLALEVCQAFLQMRPKSATLQH